MYEVGPAKTEDLPYVFFFVYCEHVVPIEMKG